MSRINLEEAMLTPAQREKRRLAAKRAEDKRIAQERQAYAKSHGLKWLGGRMFALKIRVDPNELAAARAESTSAA